MNYYDEPDREQENEIMTEDEAREHGLNIQTLEEMENRNIED